MKLEPIKNPHAKVGTGIQKKTKQEEKDELIEKTKKTTLDKYGVSIRNVFLVDGHLFWWKSNVLFEMSETLTVMLCIEKSCWEEVLEHCCSKRFFRSKRKEF